MILIQNLLEQEENDFQIIILQNASFIIQIQIGNENNLKFIQLLKSKFNLLNEKFVNKTKKEVVTIEQIKR